MPQPFQPPSGFGYSTNALWVAQHQPDCVSAIGLIALQWTAVEHQLHSVVAGVLGSTSASADGGWGINPNRFVATAMEQVDTSRARIRVANAFLKPVLSDHVLAQRWTSVVESLNKRSMERNGVVHGSWGWSEQKPEHLLKVAIDGSLTVWTNSDFTNIQSRITLVSGELDKLMRDILSAAHNEEIKGFLTADLTALHSGGGIVIISED